MTKITSGRKSRTIGYAVGFTLLLLLTVVLPIFMKPSPVSAGSNSYPTSIAGCRYVSNGGSAGTCNLAGSTQDEYYDPWSEENRECTSYVAWMLSSVNGYTMPFFDDAVNWGPDASSRGITVNMTPAIGSVYWSKSKDHVAYVENVTGGGSTVTLEDYNSGYPTNPGNWAEHTGVAVSSASGFIHFKDISTSNPPSTPTAIALDNNDMSLFYNDGNNDIVNWSWNANNNPGWQYQAFDDPGGYGVDGQPTVISSKPGTMDLFYRGSSGQLVHMSWSSTNSWSAPAVLATGLAGDPTAIARDSSDMQVFWRDTSGNIKSINWTPSGWNTSAQLLYTAAATTDPYAVSRSSDSMEVFFSKNNGDIIHLGWSSEYSWVTQDWSVPSAVVSKPTAIAWNSGGDMAAFFQEANGDVGEEAWDSVNSWSQQSWAASLAGNPSAVAGVSNTVDDFYRETAGNVVDRYLNGGTWTPVYIEPTGSATGNPFAIDRGTTNQEVFYWDGGSLEDAHWDTTGRTWETSTIN